MRIPRDGLQQSADIFCYLKAMEDDLAEVGVHSANNYCIVVKSIVTFRDNTD